jgi:hypothetical protein
VGYAANDMASRTIAWTLALGYDWMHDYLNTFQKAAIVSSIRAHAQPMFDDIGPRISKYPMDSHGNVSLTLLAAIGALIGVAVSALLQRQIGEVSLGASPVEITATWSVMLVGIGMGLLVGLIGGIAPAIRVRRLSITSSMR